MIRPNDTVLRAARDLASATLDRVRKVRPRDHARDAAFARLLTRRPEPIDDVLPEAAE